jgi:hypothetical protein
MIRGYFSVASEVARLYRDISREYIIPGVNLVDKLGLSQVVDDRGNHETVRRNQELEQYKENAVHKIRELAGKACTSTKSNRNTTSLLHAD